MGWSDLGLGTVVFDERWLGVAWSGKLHVRIGSTMRTLASEV